MLRPGELLNDRYRLDGFLASGGMGEVWRATDVVLGRCVAVKVLLPSMLNDPGFAARFRAEARILAAFRHPNVVDVYDFGDATVEGRTAAYLVMAYVDGEPLSNRIATVGRLPVADTLSVVAQAADALDAAHAGGVIHRDVKPGNLLVCDDGTVVLVDFGVARSADITAITAANAVPGTVLYMAPEQVSGKPVAPTTDVYALGAVAYQCQAGVPPFNGEAPMEIALMHLNDEVPALPDDVPIGLRALVMRALSKDPADRFQSAAEMATAARAAAAAVGESVPRAATTRITGLMPVSPAARPVPAGATPAGGARAGGTTPDHPVAAARGAGFERGRAAVGAGPDDRYPADRYTADPYGYRAAPAAGRRRHRGRAAALVAAGGLVLAGAALAAVVAFGDEDPPARTPDTPAGSSAPAQPGTNPTGTRRPASTGPANRSTAPAPGPATSAPVNDPPGQNPGTTPPPDDDNDPQPSGSAGGGDGGDGGDGGGGTGGGDGGTGGGDEAGGGQPPPAG